MTTQIQVPTALGGISNTGTSTTRSTSGSVTDLQVSDNSYYRAIYTGAGTNSFSFRANTFNFTIPGTATINGFELLIERKRGNTGTGSCVDNTIQICNISTPVGTNKSTGTAFPTTDTNITYGGPTDMWGLSYTPSDVNSANFQVQIKVDTSVTSGTVEAQFDLVQMTVYYTAGASGKKRSVSGGASYFSGAACF